MATEAQIRKEKEEKLQDILREIGKVAITYSGGIDSSYLLKVALDTLGPDNVIAAVVNSELFSDEEFNLALDLADQLGAPILGAPYKARLTALHAICVQIFRHIALGNLPKNLTTHLTHKLCAVLP